MILLFVKNVGESEDIIPSPGDKGFSALNSLKKLFKKTIKPKEQQMKATFHNNFYCIF